MDAPREVVDEWSSLISSFNSRAADVEGDEIISAVLIRGDGRRIKWSAPAKPVKRLKRAAKCPLYQRKLDEWTPLGYFTSTQRPVVISSDTQERDAPVIVIESQGASQASTISLDFGEPRENSTQQLIWADNSQAPVTPPRCLSPDLFEDVVAVGETQELPATQVPRRPLVPYEDTQEEADRQSQLVADFFPLRQHQPSPSIAWSEDWEPEPEEELIEDLLEDSEPPPENLTQRSGRGDDWRWLIREEERLAMESALDRAMELGRGLLYNIDAFVRK